MAKKDLGKTTLGIQANIGALLCYLGGFVTGIIFYVLEKENKFIRFHAMQSIVVFGGLFVINLAIGIILPVSLGSMLSMLIGLLSFVLWVVLMVKGYQGEEFKVPVASDIVDKYVK